MTVVVEALRRPLDLETLLARLREAASSAGVEAYLVGGFVRDRLLGRPGKDIDVVTVGAPGTLLLEALSRDLGWSPPVVFERFGTAQVRGDGFVVEVVQARAERYDPESRKPSVRPGTLEQDILRRDFTCNALAQTFEGRVIDLTGRGVDDLAAGVLRTPSSAAETFSEDPLRIFRAARFAAQLGFDLAPDVLPAMREVAPRAHILSVERIAEELRRLLVAPHPARGMQVLLDGGVLEVVLPELAAMAGVEQSGHHDRDVWGHSAAALEAAPPDLVTRAAALLHDIGKPPTAGVRDDGQHTFYGHPEVGARMAADILRRLRFSNEEVEQVELLVRLHLRPILYSEEGWSDAAVRRLVRDAGALRPQLLAVARADTAASAYRGPDNISMLERRMERLDQDAGVSRLRPPLGGERVMRLAGRGPGPWVGAVLRALEEAVLDGEIPPGDAAAAEAWLGRHPEVLAGRQG